MRKLLGGAILLAGATSLAAQTFQSAQFSEHSYNISAGGFGGYTSTSTPRPTISFSVVRADGTETGTLQLRYPDTLPGGTVETRAGEAGSYLVLSSPLTVGYHIEFDYFAYAPDPPEDIGVSLHLEIAAEWTRGENSPCKVNRPLAYVRSGTTTHFSEDFECSFSRVPISLSGGEGSITIGNFFYFDTFSRACICGFLAFVGTNYRTLPPVDLTVSRIEVVQATQDVNNTVPLVAEKSTVARVFVGLGTGATQPPQVQAILRGFGPSGSELVGSPLAAENGPIPAPNQPNREATNHSLNFKLPPDWTTAGALKLRAEVNPGGSVSEADRTNNSREETVLFENRGEFHVQWVEVCYQTEDNCPSLDVSVQDFLMRKMFPVGDTRATYQSFKAPPLIWKRSLATKEAREELISVLRVDYELANDGSLDQLVGWLPGLTGGEVTDENGRAVRFPGGSSDPLWNASTRSGRVAWVREIETFDPLGTFGTGFPAATLAHELAHNLGLHHTNTPDCGGCVDDGTDWPDPASGRIHEVGFDPREMKAVRARKFDLMTYRSRPGSNIWISPFHFRKLFAANFQPQRAPLASTADPYAIVTGFARHDGTSGHLEPLFQIDSAAPPTPQIAGGNHCIRFSGASGTLSDYCFDLEFHVHPGNEELDEQHFALRIPFPSGATRVSLRRGETELAARSASANAPAVTITSPTPGATWDGRRTVAWTGTDADGDPLAYTVLYSGDGGARWIPLERNTTDRELSVDTARIRSGAQVLFRVIASDGFRTAQATAGPLTVVAVPVIGVGRNLDFGSVPLGTFGEASLLVTNRGEKSLTIAAIRADLADFSVRESLPIVVPADGYRLLTLRFTPAAEGVRSSTLTVESDDPAHPVSTATVFGAARPAPQLTAVPSSLDFGTVAIGSSRQLALKLRNTGRGTLTVLGIGSTSSEFALPSSIPLAIAEGAEVSVAVTFRPVASGTRTATVSVVTTADSGTVSAISMSGAGSGTGTGTACAVSVSPGSLSLPVNGGSGSVNVSAPAACSWEVAANAGWITVNSAAGAGNGTVSISAGPNSGIPRAAVLALGEARVTVLQNGGAESLVIPAVASTPGALDSFFKTGVQLHNPTSGPVSGSITYHPAGDSPSEEDSSLFYRLGPGETADFDDLLPEIGQTGLGSADLFPRIGPAPVATIRVFNDAGDAGTTGMTEELFRSGEALEAGQKGVLIAPPEPSRARFNIGVRSLSFGATIRFTVRDTAGAVRTTGAKFYPPSFFAQQAAEGFLGIGLLANDTVTFEVDAGSAIVYGATTDNTTQDPSLQFARSIGSGADPRRTIAAVAAAPGVLDSLFRTTLQLHNRTSSSIAGRLVFHTAGASGSDADPSVNYSLGPGATTSYADVLATFGRTGLGSLDVVATSGPVPLAVARVFNDGGARGTTGFSVDALRPSDALQPGETGVLIAPADATATRFNIGIRTFDAGASFTVTIRDRDGQVLRTFPKAYPPNYFEQQAGSTFLGAAPGPSESVTITIGTGSAIVYGASTDNKTQDPAIQVARAVP